MCSKKGQRKIREVSVRDLTRDQRLDDFNIASYIENAEMGLECVLSLHHLPVLEPLCKEARRQFILNMWREPEFILTRRQFGGKLRTEPSFQSC